MKKVFVLLLLMVFSIGMVGCGGTDNTPKSIEISGERTVQVGATSQLTAVVNPSGADQTVTWSSARDDIASVTTDGLVTGIRAGTAIVMATSTANPNVSGQVRITVEVDPDEVVRPDLGGYTIKIAQAGHALHETDPFHDNYISLNKTAKQQAWTWVEENYNCQI